MGLFVGGLLHSVCLSVVCTVNIDGAAPGLDDLFLDMIASSSVSRKIRSTAVCSAGSRDGMVVWVSWVFVDLFLSPMRSSSKSPLRCIMHSYA